LDNTFSYQVSVGNKQWTCAWNQVVTRYATEVFSDELVSTNYVIHCSRYMFPMEITASGKNKMASSC